MLTSSNPFPRGTKAPDFLLPDTISGKELSLEDVVGEKGTVVMFICNHCPFVVHVQDQLVDLAQEYRGQGIGFVAISSNDVTFVPEDGPDQMKEHASNVGYPFPYLYDQSQDVARAYDAACTPDFYVFDGDLRSIYHGRLDASRPGSDTPVTGEDVRIALDSILANREYVGKENPSIGCNIKWK